MTGWRKRQMAAQPEQQSVYCFNCEELSKQVTALKICLEVERGFREQEQPAQRTWVGLTDDDKESFWTGDQMSLKEWDELYAAVEAKLKEKNT